MTEEDRFAGSRTCHSEQDLVIYQRVAEAALDGMVEGLARDVDELAAYLLCSALVRAAEAKRSEILNRGERRPR